MPKNPIKEGRASLAEPSRVAQTGNVLLEGPSTMRERNWTRLYIEGRTPAEAAAIANTYVHDNRVPRGRKR